MACEPHRGSRLKHFQSPKRIERLATERLHLVAPDTGAAVIIERVVPADPPSASIVASAQEKPSERARIR
jgi:hypothetical protein